MIREGELRLGSWFVNCQGVFHSFGKADFALYGAFGIEWVNEMYQPIPITPGILSKISFLSLIGQEFYRVYCLDIYPKKDFVKVRINGSADIEMTYLYLHQVQNLYFVLSSEELEVHL